MDIGSLLNAGTRSSSAGASASQQAQDNQDRFLTLLVAQMRNQDPMNPMENAQLTTQIAQIQTVTGVDQLNTSLEKLGAQFNQSQLSGAVSLVGRNVTMAGNRLTMGAGEALGVFDLAAPADNVKVEITTPAGTVIDTVNLGAATSGRHAFNWSDSGYSADRELQFRIVATRGTRPVGATTFSRDQVVALNTTGGQLQFELASGRQTDFASIVSID
ncbi:flagellar hook assembly protein FlgD [Pseudorhodoferax sp.]|jgi:flagellar basal-body rod modification protein FlgD|uniref:flagellar hook assembly protein FlgD n=1 Tax=Pseudorhodoferax sp. TaxID=1993553 RepID=UPI002DD626B1|nr:flagellar hook capping FlgD N-terminal domain-containing protein [Pseudorhodoferax sp.]